MKTKLLATGVIILVTLFSCNEINSDLLLQDDCSDILYLDNIEEYNNMLDKLSNMSESELLAWEKEQGIVSYGLEAMRIYNSFEKQRFTSLDEVENFVKQNEKYLELVKDLNGELELAIRYDLGVDRYLINEDQILQIGEKLYQIDEDFIVSTNVSNLEQLKECRNNVELFKQNEIFDLKMRGEFLKSTLSECEGTEILDYSTNNKNRVKFKLKVDVKLNYDAEISYYARPQKKNFLGIWYQVYEEVGAEVNVKWKYYDALYSSGSSTTYGWVYKTYKDNSKRSLRYANEVSGEDNYSRSYYSYNENYPRFTSYEILWADTDKVSPFERSCQ